VWVTGEMRAKAKAAGEEAAVPEPEGVPAD